MVRLLVKAKRFWHFWATTSRIIIIIWRWQWVAVQWAKMPRWCQRRNNWDNWQATTELKDLTDKVAKECIPKPCVKISNFRMTLVKTSSVPLLTLTFLQHIVHYMQLSRRHTNVTLKKAKYSFPFSAPKWNQLDSRPATPTNYQTFWRHKNHRYFGLYIIQQKGLYIHPRKCVNILFVQ